MLRYLRAFIIVAVPLALLVVAALSLSAAGSAVPSGPPAPKDLVACTDCHSMDREVRTWENGRHNSVACLQCHKEGDPGWLRHELTESNQDMLAKLKAREQHTIALKVADGRCRDCHDPQMDQIMRDVVPKPLKLGASASVGTPMSVRAAHALHVDGKAKLNCQACHTVHTEKAVPDNLPQVVHARCQACHDQQNVTIAVKGSTSCQVCHMDVATVTPADHKDAPVWLSKHGQSATTAGKCGECHLAPTAGAHSIISRPESFPTKEKDSCTACHGTTMPHPAGYLSVHGTEAQKNPTTCTACHVSKDVTKRPTALESARGEDCLACHGTAMPHPDSYLKVHTRDAAQSPKLCEACHSVRNALGAGASALQPANNCLVCHGTAMPHAAQYVAQHGKDALAQPATCQACHSAKNPVQPAATHASTAFCASCHAGHKHPAMWFITHGNAVGVKGKESCLQCHSPSGGQVSCTQCHSKQ